MGSLVRGGDLGDLGVIGPDARLEAVDRPRIHPHLLVESVDLLVEYLDLPRNGRLLAFGPGELLPNSVQSLAHPCQFSGVAVGPDRFSPGSKDEESEDQLEANRA